MKVNLILRWLDKFMLAMLQGNYMATKEFKEELELQLVEIEKDIAWWDYKLSSEGHHLAPQQKYELLKKKWAVLTGLKNIGRF